VLDRLTTVATRLLSLHGAALIRALTDLDALLQEQLLPHERADDNKDYPVVAELLGGDDPMAAMSRTHREIFMLHQRLHGLIARVPPEAGSDPDTLQDLQRTLYALDAILRLHFAQEEEIYHGLTPG
jgi:iron-sulfur cluster repair protein YtfE (RIC family)